MAIVGAGASLSGKAQKWTNTMIATATSASQGLQRFWHSTVLPGAQTTVPFMGGQVPRGVIVPALGFVAIDTIEDFKSTGSPSRGIAYLSILSPGGWASRILFAGVYGYKFEKARRYYNDDPLIGMLLGLEAANAIKIKYTLRRVPGLGEFAGLANAAKFQGLIDFIKDNREKDERLETPDTDIKK